MAKLQCPVMNGGLATPDFEAYYLAALMQWFTQWVASGLILEGAAGPLGPPSHAVFWFLLNPSGVLWGRGRDGQGGPGDGMDR
ncbi:hypothetical protein NDU88_004658 [Pleurodeles waltl]|uniref:Uncharacterized protein n=1 Tax=Pleurodeles waltl TaxID=8319 RepID=A0AAV7T8S0_PLEWA|nr:hypothetical protein NDU88_004658 [Pleurodeles waltl]